MADFGVIPKIFSKIKEFSQKIVENHVDNVEKNAILSHQKMWKTRKHP